MFYVHMTLKRLVIDRQLPLDTNRKSYVGTPTAPLDLTLCHLESQIHGHSNFEALYLIKQHRYTICYY